MKPTYQQKLDAVITHAQNLWSRAAVDTEHREAATKQIKMVAELSYYEGISDLEWLSTILKELQR